MARRPPRNKKSFENLFEYESFLTILRYYVDLNCFVIAPDPGNGATNWLAVNYHQRPASLFDFEKKYKFKFDWTKLTDGAYEAQRKGQPLLLESLGFQDVFMPIRRNGKRIGTILSGAFSDREITSEQLRNSWHRLTGKAASSESVEFREFVKVMLETPVLEGPVLSAYREALELFAGVLAFEDHPKVSERLKELVTKVFSKNFSHSYWMDWALGLPTRQATPLWNREVQELDWVRLDVGITRVPTTVMTAIPLPVPGKKRDPIEEMIRVYRFQRKSFRFAQTLPQTVGGKLENYGAIFVASADPSLRRPQRRRQIEEIAEKIHRFAVEALGGPVLVGIGETVAPGEFLSESYRQAVWALHLGRGVGKEIVFFTPDRAEKMEGVLELKGLLLGLKALFETGSFANLGGTLNGFLKQVLTLSFQNPEEIRWHLQYGVLHLCEAAKGRTDLPEKETARFQDGLILALERSGTTQEMISVFKDGLEKLSDLVRGGDPGKDYSIEKIRDHLERNFRRRQGIFQLSKKAGVSVSTFSRHFKKTTGVGFNAYLQNLRLEEARRLLKTGSLPVSQIARSCGFKSGAYFTRLFRKKMRITPQEFRKNSRLD